MKKTKKANKSLQNSVTKQASSREKTRSRADKARRRAALERMVSSLGYDPSRVHITDTSERSAARTSRDERRAVGTFRSSDAGYGFVALEGAARDIFIPKPQTAGAIDGDTVEVLYTVYTHEGEERTCGRVRRITDGRRTLIGTLVRAEEHRGRYGGRTRAYTLLPDDRRVHARIVILDRAGAHVGDKVEARLVRRTDRTEGQIVRVFGSAEDVAASYEAILADVGVTVDFTEEELRDAERAARRSEDTEGRTDLRSELIFTVDGADAKDLDDALSIRRTPSGGYRLGVHIADVSHFVEEKTPLDRAVMHRGCSLYFADRVVPMLPYALSSGVCSLSEGDDRLAISAHITLSAQGDILHTCLRPTVIRSRLRGVYHELNDVIEHGTSSAYAKKYRPVRRALASLLSLCEIRTKRARARGALELEQAEAQIVLDEHGHPTDIIPRTRGLAEDIIEQCMLIANEAVASLFEERSLPCVYRVHDKPPTERATELIGYAYNLGLDVRGIDPEAPTVRDLSLLLKEARESGMELAVSYRTLRSMAKATYKTTPDGHFGLALRHYCHFTAPIRRLSDLAVHRILHRTFFEGQPAARFAPYAARAARAASDTELRAQEAERRIGQLFRTLYMQDRIGEVFHATVTGITRHGLYCMTDATCEGFLPITELCGVFTFDEPMQTLRSRDGVICLGDRIPVRLTEASVATGTLTFSDASGTEYLSDGGALL